MCLLGMSSLAQTNAFDIVCDTYSSSFGWNGKENEPFTWKIHLSIDLSRGRWCARTQVTMGPDYSCSDSTSRILSVSDNYITFHDGKEKEGAWDRTRYLSLNRSSGVLEMNYTDLYKGKPDFWMRYKANCERRTFSDFTQRKF